MALDAAQSEELKSQIAIARKRPLNFGICLASKPEDTALIMHRMKSPDVLARTAKKEGEGNKVTFGTMSCKGKVLTLTIDGKLLPGMAKKTKLFLRQAGLKLTVVLLDPDGGVFEQDVDDEDESSDGGSFEGDDPDAIRWARTEARMTPQVARAASTSGDGDPTKLRAVWAKALELGNGGDYASALKIADALAVKLAAAGVDQEGDGGADAAREEWLARLAQIKRPFAAALKSGQGDISRMRAIWAAANEKADASPPDYAYALRALGKLQEMLDGLSSLKVDEPPTPGADGTVEAAAKAHDALAAMKGKTDALKAVFTALPDRRDAGMALAAAVKDAVALRKPKEAEDALAAIDKFLADAEPQIAAKAVCLRDLPLLQARHAKIDQLPPATPILATIAAARDAATPAAAGPDWVVGKAALEDWAGKLTTAEAEQAAYVEKRDLFGTKRKALEDSFAPVKARMKAFTDVDYAPMATLSSGPALAQARTETLALSARIDAVVAEAAPADLDAGIAAVDTAAGELKSWIDGEGALTAKAAGLGAEALDALTTAYNVISASVDKSRNLVPSEFDGKLAASDLSDAKAKYDAMVQSYTKLEAAWSGSSPDAVTLMALMPEVEVLRLAAEASSTAYWVAWKKSEEKRFDDLGCSSADRDLIVDLAYSNFDAFNAISSSLNATSAAVDGAPATAETISQKAAEFAQTQADWKAATKAKGDLEKEHKALNDEAGELQKQIEELDQKISSGADEAEGGPTFAEQKATVVAQKQAKDAEVTAKGEKVTEKQAEIDALNTQWDKRSQAQKAAIQRKAMIDAMTHGPLSAAAGHGFSDEQKAKLARAYGVGHGFGEKTAMLAAGSDTPDKVIETAEKIMDAWEASGSYFNDENYTGEFAKGALERAVRLGPEYLTELEAHIRAGNTFWDDPSLAGNPKPTERHRRRAQFAAEALLVEKTTTPQDGSTPTTELKLDPNDPNFVKALSNMSCSSSSMFTPSSTTVEAAREFKTFLSTGTNLADCQDVLDTITGPPPDEPTKKLIADTLGIEPGAVDAKAVKLAVLTAMIAPVEQGEVGSCFATAPLIKFRKDDPIAVIKSLTEIATTGKFTPKGRPAIPAVKTHKGDGIALSRSLEYSIASAGAEIASSRERAWVNDALYSTDPSDTSSLAQIEAKLTAEDWAKLKPVLQERIKKSYSFQYDPTKDMAGASSDGSSKFGHYDLIDKSTGQPIQSEAKFVEFIDRVATEAATDTGVSTDGVAKVKAFVAEPAFINAIKSGFGKNPPWNMSFGGFGDTASDAIHGGDARSTEIVSPTGTPSEKATAVLKNIVGQLGGGADSRIVATSGMHSFSALPNNSSLASLASGPGTLDDRIKTELTDKAAALKTQVIPKERAVFMYEQEIAKILNEGYSADATTELARVIKEPPTGDVTAKGLDDHLKAKLGTFEDIVAKSVADSWKEKKDVPPGTVSTADYEKHKAEAKKGNEEYREGQRRSMMIERMEAPQFVIADTNWGDGDSHQHFVIAPDPVTGDIGLWSKDSSSGTMSKMGDDWVSASWMLEG